MKNEKICKNVFKNDVITKEIFTNKWIEMVQQIENNKFVKGGDKQYDI